MSAEAQLMTVTPLHCAPHHLLPCPLPGGRMAAELPGLYPDNIVCLAQEGGNVSQKCPRACLLVSLTRTESHGFSWTSHWQGEWGADGNQPGWNRSGESTIRTGLQGFLTSPFISYLPIPTSAILAFLGDTTKPSTCLPPHLFSIPPPSPPPVLTQVPSASWNCPCSAHLVPVWRTHLCS